MRVYFRDDRKWKGHHWSREMKYRTLWMILFLFIIFSVYFLLPENRTDHDRGTTSSELTKIEKTEGNITRVSYVDTSGKLTYAIDKRYAIFVQTKDEEGRVLEEHYLDENEEPTACWGYFGISYEHREGEDIITYLDEEGNPVKTQSGYAIIVRSLDELGQALDDRYYDENWNPVMCTGGYYGMHREHDEKGRTKKMQYYGSEYIKCILEETGSLFKNEGELYRLLYGGYAEPDEFGKRPLSKFIKDIYQNTKNALDGIN